MHAACIFVSHEAEYAPSGLGRKPESGLPYFRLDPQHGPDADLYSSRAIRRMMPFFAASAALMASYLPVLLRLGDRALDPWACGRRTRAANERKTRRLLINRPGSSVAFLEFDSNERLRVSNWIVQKLLSDCEGKVHGLPTVR